MQNSTNIVYAKCQDKWKHIQFRQTSGCWVKVHLYILAGVMVHWAAVVQGGREVRWCKWRQYCGNCNKDINIVFYCVHRVCIFCIWCESGQTLTTVPTPCIVYSKATNCAHTHIHTLSPGLLANRCISNHFMPQAPNKPSALVFVSASLASRERHCVCVWTCACVSMCGLEVA